MQLLTDEKFLPAAILLLSDAQKSIDISTFKAEMTTKPRGRRLKILFDLIIEKARLGIPVRFLISKREEYGHIPLTNLFAVREMKANGVQVRHLRNSRLCHAKTIIIDDELAILGSHNLSIKSCHNNFEASVCITKPYIVGQLKGFFTVAWEDARKA